MGANREAITVLWDTGSSWLVIEGYECATCDNENKYNYATETGNSFNRKSSNNDNVKNYGSVSSKGFFATDTVCLTNSSTTCTSNFDIFIMMWQ